MNSLPRYACPERGGCQDEQEQRHATVIVTGSDIHRARRARAARVSPDGGAPCRGRVAGRIAGLWAIRWSNDHDLGAARLTGCVSRARKFQGRIQITSGASTTHEIAFGAKSPIDVSKGSSSFASVACITAGCAVGGNGVQN